MRLNQNYLEVEKTLNTFFSSFSYSKELLFTFGCGAMLLLIAYFISRNNKLAAVSFIVLSLSSISFGITRILEEYSYLDHNSLLRLSPSIGLLLFILLIYFSGLQMAKDNKEIKKLLNIGLFLTLVFLIPFAIIGVYAYTR